MAKIDSVYDISDKALVEIKSWLEPWFKTKDSNCACVPIGLPSLSELILATPDLMGFWKLNESSGDIAHDSFDGWDMDSGAGNPPTWGQAAGPPGDVSAEFGATLQENSSSFGALSGDLTLEIWANRNNTTDSQFLFQQGTPAVANHAGVALFIANSSTGLGNKLIGHIGDTTGGPHAIEGDTSLSPGTWYHCAVTRATHIWTLYLNGVAQTNTYDDTGTNYSSTTGLQIGADATAKLSYAAAFDRALTASEIHNHYVSGVVSGTVPDTYVLMADGAGGTSWQPHRIIELGLGETMDVKDSSGATIFRVDEDGDLHGKTGKALTFDL